MLRSNLRNTGHGCNSRIPKSQSAYPIIRASSRLRWRRQPQADRITGGVVHIGNCPTPWLLPTPTRPDRAPFRSGIGELRPAGRRLAARPAARGPAGGRRDVRALSAQYTATERPRDSSVRRAWPGKKGGSREGARPRPRLGSDRAPPATGPPVAPGDRLRTGSDSRAWVQWPMCSANGVSAPRSPAAGGTERVCMHCSLSDPQIPNYFLMCFYLTDCLRFAKLSMHLRRNSCDSSPQTPVITGLKSF
jgi:hypothetical protein